MTLPVAVLAVQTAGRLCVCSDNDINLPRKALFGAVGLYNNM